MQVNTLVQDCHKMSNDKGFNDNHRSALEFHMLFVTEIAEATECVRNDEAPMWCMWKGKTVFIGSMEFRMAIDSGAKPEGETIEIADLLIRIFDYCGVKKMDIEEAIQMKMNYNLGRDYRHGGKLY